MANTPKIEYKDLELEKVYKVSGSKGQAGGTFLYNNDKIKVTAKHELPNGQVEWEVEVFNKEDKEWEEYSLPTNELFTDNLRFTEIVPKEAKQ